MIAELEQRIIYKKSLAGGKISVQNGNTLLFKRRQYEKLARAIGEELGIPAETTEVPLDEDVDILFLGSSVYAYGVDDHVKVFINDIHVNIGIVYNFSTAALIKSSYPQVNKLLLDKQICLATEEYACKGEFGPLHRGKPDARNLKEARKFARKMVNKYVNEHQI